MSAPITEEALSTILRQYPLSEARALGPMEASKRNDNFLVEDAMGQRYVLRRYRRNPDERRIAFQLRFQQELRRRGFPTADVLETAAGDLLLIEAGNSWALFTYVEGDEFDFTRMGQVAEAGRRLAQFHTVTDSIELEEVTIPHNPTARRWWTHGEEELAALEAMFRGEGVEDELTFLCEWRASLVREWPLVRLDILPSGWIHSDFHGRNVVFVGDELRGLFDFDPLHRGFWVEDVAHALFMFGRESRGSRRIRPQAARLFLHEYHRARPLLDDERAALPMMAVLVWSPSAPYHELLRRDGEDTLAFFRHYVELMRDIGAEMARLGSVLIGG
ncbi:MAG: hypothetical protein A2148_08870 [Chloroflexi bacterium RBG_16_68_14]|nr:MAG: hypothetical protein A2148_08870 [Chloroflexi bacterium RBG_16_68_14]